MNHSDPCQDPDLRDPNEETASRAAQPNRGTASPVDPRVRNGKFDDGWCEVIGLLAATLTEEQRALLQRRFQELTGGGSHGK